MASWDLSPAFERVRKRLGNMVFYNLEGDTFARKMPKKRDKSSQAQEEIKEAFTALSANWKYLEGVIQDSWSMHAKKKKRLRGYSAFMGANVKHQRYGEPFELSKPMGETGLASFAAHPGSSAGEITCEFVKNSQDAGKHVTFFRQKRVNGHAAGDIVRIDAGNGAVSIFTIIGCETGCEYYIYALVTDKAYGEATTVSFARAEISVSA